MPSRFCLLLSIFVSSILGKGPALSPTTVNTATAPQPNERFGTCGDCPPGYYCQWSQVGCVSGICNHAYSCLPEFPGPFADDDFPDDNFPCRFRWCR